jgi:anti-anti-sigma factor
VTLLLDRRGARLEETSEGLSVSGEVDFDVAAQLAETGGEWLDEQPADTPVVFDLREVAGVSSAALSVLLEWTRRARSAGVEVSGVRLSSALIRLTRLAGLDRLLPLDEAA